MSLIATPSLDSKELRMSYRIGRGEQGVLTFEPYKSALLPYWRFKTCPIAEKSSQDLWQKFVEYGDADDFVGQDMTRKFIQMGMTRAKRYANHKGGRKYDLSEKEANGAKQTELPKSVNHKDNDEKEAASLIFRVVWEKCKRDEKYQDLKERFMAEQKAWDKEQKQMQANTSM